MALGVRGSNPIWAEFDLAGKIFDDTFYMYVLKNILPYEPATVYHDPDLNIPWTNPIRFLGNGTLPVDVFFESNMVYRLEFRKNDGFTTPSQSDPLMYEVNNYIAGNGSSNVDTVAFASSNQITNPQFALINFVSPYTFNGTDPAPIEVAPGWFLNLSGSGSVTINQVPLNNANQNPSNAPYALRLTLNGWTTDSVFLSQRFFQNGMLWANKIVSTAITAKLNGANNDIGVTLVDSNNSTLAIILPANTTINQNFEEYTGYGELTASTNPNIPPAAYIDYKLSIPSNIDIYITSIQLIVEDVPVEQSFIQDSVNRQIDQTFHYYLPKLSFKPIPNYLVGWNFPLNPAQFGVSGALGAIGANRATYVWDQTIVQQSTNNSVSYNQNANGDLTLTASADTQIALVQYISGYTAFEMLSRNMSATATLSSLNRPNLTISLWYTTNPVLPNVAPGANLTFVNTLDTNGHPSSVAAGWVEVARTGGNATFVCPSTVDNLNNATVGFSGWNALALSVSSTAKYFAIVMGTSTIVSGSSLEFNQISLVPGDIPTITPPKTQDETLHECQFYYEKSYDVLIPPATPTSINTITSIQTTGLTTDGGGNVISYGILATSFSKQWRVPKRVTPVLITYSEGGDPTALTLYYSVTGVLNGPVPISNVNWNFSRGTDAFKAVSVPSAYVVSTGTGLVQAFISYHYVADARLGIVL